MYLCVEDEGSYYERCPLLLCTVYQINQSIIGVCHSPRLLLLDPAASGPQPNHSDHPCQDHAAPLVPGGPPTRRADHERPVSSGCCQLFQIEARATAPWNECEYHRPSSICSCALTAVGAMSLNATQSSLYLSITFAPLQGTNTWCGVR